jgi:hypothetical protein
MSLYRMTLLYFTVSELCENLTLSSRLFEMAMSYTGRFLPVGVCVETILVLRRKPIDFFELKL